MKPATAMTNEELLEAISSAMAEARRRRISHAADCAAFGIPPQEASEISAEAVREEIEKIQQRQTRRIIKQAQEKARKEAEENQRREEQIKNWTMKKELALLIQEALGKGWSLNVWNKDDKRVYIDGLGRKKIIYYCEGNRYNPPGKLSTQQIKLTKEQKEILMQACRKADEDWQTVRFSVDEAARFAWQAPRPLGVEEHDIEIEVA